MSDPRLNPNCDPKIVEFLNDLDRRRTLVQSYLRDFGGCVKCKTVAVHLTAFGMPCFRYLQIALGDILSTGSGFDADAFMESRDAIAVCSECIPRIRANGSWSGILEARRLEAEKLAKEKTDARPKSD